MIYKYPEVYAAALSPSAAVVDAVHKIIKWHTINTNVVCDPACGAGCWLNTLSTSKRLIGIDIEPKMIDYCNRNRTARGNAEFHLGSMDDLHFLNTSSVDLILNMESAIGHLGSPDRVKAHLHECNRVLSRGGTYIFSAVLAAGDEVFDEPYTILQRNDLMTASGKRFDFTFRCMERNRLKNYARMQVDVAFAFPHAANNFCSDYIVQTFEKNWFEDAIREAGFQFDQAYSLDSNGAHPIHLVNNCGQVVIVLSKKS